MATIEFDNRYRREGISLICGIDEAGRGPLAGPVVAAAVMYDARTTIPGVNDSKKITPSRREELFPRITGRAAAWSFSVLSNDQVDEMNILNASLEAMRQSVEKLNIRPHLLLVDGNKLFNTPIPAVAVVKGDCKSFAIASASIIAKVVRDRMMADLAVQYPHYHWGKNKGYPTRDHIRAVLEYGPSPYHRQSFLRNIEQWRKNEL